MLFNNGMAKSHFVNQQKIKYSSKTFYLMADHLTTLHCEAVFSSFFPPSFFLPSFFFFQGRVSLCGSGYPGTNSADQVSLELGDLPPEYWD